MGNKMQMNKFLLSLCFLFLLGSNLVATHEQIKTKAELDAQENKQIDMILESIKDKRKRDIFPRFHFLYKKTYELQSKEGEKRYKIFKANMKWAKQKNAELGKQVYGITPYMDLTDEEFRNFYLKSGEEMKKILEKKSSK